MSDLTNAIYQRGFSEPGEDDPLRDFMATYFEHDDEVTRSQVIDFIDRIIRLAEPDAGEGTELHGLPEGFSTEPAVKERGVLVAPTPDTTEATLRAAASEFLDAVEEGRPYTNKALRLRAALQQPAVQPEGGPE
jgi:hypothetical protein